MVAQLCLTLCSPINCSPPGSSVHGIFQARILECVAVSFSRVSSWPRDRTCVSSIDRQILYNLDTWEAHLVTKYTQLYMYMCICILVYVCSMKTYTILCLGKHVARTVLLWKMSQWLSTAWSGCGNGCSQTGLLCEFLLHECCSFEPPVTLAVSFLFCPSSVFPVDQHVLLASDSPWSISTSLKFPLLTPWSELPSLLPGLNSSLSFIFHSCFYCVVFIESHCEPLTRSCMVEPLSPSPPSSFLSPLD